MGRLHSMMKVVIIVAALMVAFPASASAGHCS
jgi:hypothetical protein